MNINLSKTQVKTLLKALKELSNIEALASCNDVFSDDKFYLLSKTEQNHVKSTEPDELIWNSSASNYLYDLIYYQFHKK